LYELPETGFYKEKDNQVAQIFWGRAEVENATAQYFFKKGNRIQRLMHQMKYQGQKQIGEVLGKRMGEKLERSCFNNIDVVVPVPLHPKKMSKRGYNQSEWIARGVGASMNKPMDAKTLIRHSATNTQTRKKRYERWENVASGFGLSDPESLAGKHVLLIDDVITTGATLEACIHTILCSPESKVSVAALAFASI
jgi:ComF family protein